MEILNRNARSYCLILSKKELQTIYECLGAAMGEYVDPEEAEPLLKEMEKELG